MSTHYKIIPEPHPADKSITLLLNGKFSEDSIPELAQSLSDAKQEHDCVVIDLSEVTLVDRHAVRYFSEQASEEVKLVNCPIYLRRWIAQVSDETEI
jgi:ABC-type transporter Mla MlaB component